jgi:hypothetical protein
VKSVHFKGINECFLNETVLEGQEVDATCTTNQNLQVVLIGAGSGLEQLAFW